MHVSMEVNGTTYQGDVEPRLLLVSLLRENLAVTGTKVGCDTTWCGACTISPRRGVCQELHRVRRASRRGSDHDDRRARRRRDPAPGAAGVRENHCLQCGFCAAGMVMASVSLLREHPRPTEAQVRESLEGNLCRCTGYHNIVRAVLAAAGR